MSLVVSVSKAGVLSAALLTTFVYSPAARAANCESLRSVSIPNTTITKTELVPAGAFPAPPGRGGGEGGRPRFDDLPAFCRVAATSRPTNDSEIKIEVWLPSTTWNGKLRGTGNGGRRARRLRDGRQQHGTRRRCGLRAQSSGKDHRLRLSIGT